VETVGFILGLVLMGLIVGALARLLVPGRDRMSVPATILLGIVGSILGGVLARYVFDADGGASFVLALVTTIVLLFVLRATTGRGRGRRGTI
jgi:uncharacterized membrane protein YeaQ/YmgE (transglycosylase-associated protein family)